MNKLVIIFLLSIYSSSTIGAVVDYHYCHNHLANVSVLIFQKPGGCQCEDQTCPKGCCKDKAHFSKVPLHMGAQTLQIAFTGSFFLGAGAFAVSNLTGLLAEFDGPATYVPPSGRSCKYPIYLVNNNLRI